MDSTTTRDAKSAAPILVGVDGSANSEIALWWAVDLAEALRRPLRLLTCYSLPTYVGLGVAVGWVAPLLTSDELHEIDARHRTAIEDLRSRILLGHPDLEVETYLDQGSPAAALLKASEDASMIVLGTRGVGGTAAFLMGSVSYAVAHRATCPVMLVPETATRVPGGRVVVGIDGSGPAVAAAKWAVHLADGLGRSVELVTAWQYPYSAMAPEGGMLLGPDIEELRMAMLRDARSLVQRVRKELDRVSEHHVEIDTEIIEGSAADALVETARAQDVLVVGSRSHSVLASVMLGSVATGVAHRGHSPVVIVH
jgi:nucleotide-binding universal stress UspA family protein